MTIDRSNGAIVTFLERMAADAETRFGREHPLTVFLAHWTAHWFPGFLCDLDEVLATAEARRQFAELLGRASDAILREENWPLESRRWIEEDVTALRARIERDVA